MRQPAIIITFQKEPHKCLKRKGLGSEVQVAVDEPNVRVLASDGRREGVLPPKRLEAGQNMACDALVDCPEQ